MRVLEALDNCFALRVAVFLILPACMVLLVYTLPQYSAVWVVPAVVALIVLVLYLKTRRKNELPLVLTIMPNSAGPILANMYAERYFPKATELLANGGDVLVALAFFWASYVALVFYLAARDTRNASDKIAWGAAILILLVIIFTGTGFATDTLLSGPTILGSHQAPAITWLLVVRISITVTGTFEAIRPLEK